MDKSKQYVLYRGTRRVNEGKKTDSHHILKLKTNTISLLSLAYTLKVLSLQLPATQNCLGVPK